MASFADDDLDLSDKAQSVDEYARSNGLTINSVLDTAKILSGISQLHHLFSSTEDGDYLRPLRLPSLSLHELPQVSKASVDLLNQVHHREDMSAMHDALHKTWNTARAKKLESPLLQTDIEIDCFELERDIRTKRVADVQAKPPPAEPLDPSHDEALTFPEGAYAYHQELSETLLSDRVAISRDAIDYLKGTMDYDLKDPSSTVLLEITTLRRPRLQKITPPLSPVKSQEEYFLPDPYVSKVPLSSDPSTLLDADLDAAQKALFQRQPSSSPAVSPLLSPIEVAVVKIDLPRIESLKLEEPLMPLDKSPTNLFSFRQAVADLETSIIDDDDLNSDPCEDLNDMLSDDLFTTFRDAAVQSVQEIEQEQLEPADAVARLPVLIMDFTLPDFEWIPGSSDPNHLFKTIMSSCDKALIPIWADDHKAELQLQWIPFSTKLGKISLDEVIEDTENSCFIDLEEVQFVPDSSAYVWKQPGLAVLRDPGDEELSEPDLERAMNREKYHKKSQLIGKSLDALVRKRKLEADTTASSDTASALTGHEMGPNTSLPLCPSKYILVGLNDPAAPSTLLENFVSFHAPRRLKLGESPFFSKSAGQTLLPPKINIRKPEMVELQKEIASTTSKPLVIYAPYPIIKPEGVPAYIITALTLPRGIITWLEKLLPQMNITERDFDRWNTLTWDRKSVSRSPIISSLAAEADVVVSPSTGIVITSFIRAIQRPLPGQKGKAAIRDKIEKVSQRYERLIVLVSESNRMDESIRALSDSECAAFAEFSGFAAGLNTETQVYYVGGGEETLSRWLAYFIAKYSYAAREMDNLLIETETTWELFLRRAGMNAFAAQIVLSALKGPRGAPKENPARRVLAEFANMSLEQRISEFGHLLGGERVLRRVSAVLDSPWD